jgi:hypothetical protein
MFRNALRDYGHTLYQEEKNLLRTNAQLVSLAKELHQITPIAMRGNRNYIRQMGIKQRTLAKQIANRAHELFNNNPQFSKFKTHSELNNYGIAHIAVSMINANARRSSSRSPARRSPSRSPSKRSPSRSPNLTAPLLGSRNGSNSNSNAAPRNRSLFARLFRRRG